MGDFEDVFGAGADAADIIDRYNREYFRDNKRGNASRRLTPKDDELKAAEQRDELDAWRASMSARGYTPGPRFSSYEELAGWDKTNKRPHVRRPTPFGYEVYFTDSKDSDPPAEHRTQRTTKSTTSLDNEFSS